MVEPDRDTDLNGSNNERMYCLQDANCNTISIVTTAGAVGERYRYDPYGAETILDANFTPEPRTSGSTSTRANAWSRRGCITSATAISARVACPHP